jgi:hypothetical protein
MQLKQIHIFFHEFPYTLEISIPYLKCKQICLQNVINDCHPSQTTLKNKSFHYPQPFCFSTCLINKQISKIWQTIKIYVTLCQNNSIMKENHTQIVTSIENFLKNLTIQKSHRMHCATSNNIT